MDRDQKLFFTVSNNVYRKGEFRYAVLPRVWWRNEVHVGYKTLRVQKLRALRHLSRTIRTPSKAETQTRIGRGGAPETTKRIPQVVAEQEKIARQIRSVKPFEQLAPFFIHPFILVLMNSQLSEFSTLVRSSEVHM